MSTRLLRLAALAAVVLTVRVASAEEGVLYWMVGEGATVTGGDPNSQSIKAYLDTYEAATEGSWSAARVRVIGGESDMFLDLYDGNGGTTSGEYGVVFDAFEGVWGAGAPDGVQSSISSGTPEYSFIIELGNVTNAGGWTTVAQGSSTMTYTQLAAADYIHPKFDINPPSSMIWAPTAFTAVPEPSGGLLTLMGAALLALRRRRMGEVA